MNSYAKKLRDPRWQKMRLKVFERDNWTCQACFCDDESLQVHHKFYVRGKEPWDYEMSALKTLCEHCHEVVTEINRAEKGQPMTRRC